MVNLKVGFLSSIYRSIADFGLYKEISQRKLSASFGYLAKLLLVAAIVLALRYSLDFGRLADDLIQWYDEAIGLLEVKNGEVNFNKAQPFKVEKYNFTFSVDTTGKVKEVEGFRGFLFTKDKFFYKNEMGRVSEYSFLKTDSFKIDKNFFSRLKQTFYGLACLFIFLGTYLISFIAKLIQLFCFSVFSVFINLLTAANLRYKSLLNIGIYALTPSIVLGFVVAGLRVNVPFFWILYSGIYLIFIIMGIINSKKADSSL